MTYLLNPRATTTYTSGSGRNITVEPERFLDAIHETHSIIDQISSFHVDISEILGMRNLSAFVGELFAASLISVTGDDYRKNPHQDGYPDLLLMDQPGVDMWSRLEQAGLLRDKQPFSPFPNGGIEVKATCGSVPTAARCRKLGLDGKPGIGDQRASLLMGYDWKAHHRDTNNLAGIVWDFIEQRPRIVAVFFCPSLVVEDWGEIVKPKEGGGRTTSVSIMTREGVRKMYEHWVAVYDDDPRYKDFFNRRNKGSLLPSL